jgi:hypothetical protein
MGNTLQRAARFPRWSRFLRSCWPLTSHRIEFCAVWPSRLGPSHAIAGYWLRRYPAIGC